MYPKFKLLRRAMFENSMTQKDIAKLLDRSSAYVSLRMTGQLPFDIDEIYKLCDDLKIPGPEIYLYFPPGGVERGRGERTAYTAS